MNILKVSLKRRLSEPEGTFGKCLFGSTEVHSLEPPWRGNARGKSCIPPGKYLCRLKQSPRFGRVYEVTGVQGRSEILIHPANFAGDPEAGWTTELQGCIALGLKSGFLRNPQGSMQRALLVSRPAVGQFMLWAAGNPFELEIT
jgi:hypothetical protein